MRIHFSSTKQPKKAAKFLSEASSSSLSACQQQVAKSCGYRDWHDLEKSLCSINVATTQEVSIETEVAVIVSISQALGLGAGDAQHTLTVARLFRAGPPNLQHELEVRRRLFQNLDNLPSEPKSAGCVVKMKAKGAPPQIGIVSSWGSTVTLITQARDASIVADYEVITPRKPLPLFIPLRLYFPYGLWTEKDGSEVLFSRDYLPMWRLRPGLAPERLDPWERVYQTSMTHLWEEEAVDLDQKGLGNEAIQMLHERGVRSLPKLVDVLPIMISEHCRVVEAVSKLNELQKAPHNTNSK